MLPVRRLEEFSRVVRTLNSSLCTLFISKKGRCLRRRQALGESNSTCIECMLLLGEDCTWHLRLSPLAPGGTAIWATPPPASAAKWAVLAPSSGTASVIIVAFGFGFGRGKPVLKRRTQWSVLFPMTNGTWRNDTWVWRSITRGLL